MDIIFHRPMLELLNEVPLTDDVSETLIGMKTIRKPFLDLAIACEEVRWDDMITGANLLNVSHTTLNNIYRSRCMGN
ncbi:hypothetical protein C7437_103150 [Psychrobacillus insolitus]|uniref:Uncharacterized protein n=1 Tax=Psychrobacillus insolitus TaxID=1461 RepID=A0A2W7PCP5_9BACI|nr:hypothetical protein [Psychrobacillus insolitus]PZX04899.1 hypothetical protein C7437_103150 [Psychrobacillus insolitus]